MNRLVFVVALMGGLTASSVGCESEDSVASPPGGGGATGGSGHDASDAGAGGTGAGGTGGSSFGGSTQDASWPEVGGAGTAGAAGVSGSGGAAGTQAGGSAGAAGGSAGAAGEPCGEGQGGSGGPCEFPQGVPDPDFFCWAGTYQDTDPAVDAAVNAAMVELSGCSAGSDCTITGFPGTTVDEICQSWFAGVTQRLREQGFCAGQHAVGGTDEIAVSATGCTGKWYGYHICNYGGGKVVWNPGARRGWWMIEPSYCPP